MAGEGSQLGGLLKAASSFYLATVLLGVKQLREVLYRCDTRPAADIFDTLTRTTEAQLDRPLLRTFHAGNQLQSGLCEFASDLLAWDTFTSRGMTRIFFQSMQQSAGALAAVSPDGKRRAALREFRNKVHVFNLFENVDRVLRLAPGTDLYLSKLIDQTSGMDPFNAVWITEGIGHYYTETAWQSSGAPRDLLTDIGARNVPPRSFVALNAGMGLSLANRVLAGVGRAC